MDTYEALIFCFIFIKSLPAGTPKDISAAQGTCPHGGKVQEDESDPPVSDLR